MWPAVGLPGGLTFFLYLSSLTRDIVLMLLVLIVIVYFSVVCISRSESDSGEEVDVNTQ